MNNNIKQICFEDYEALSRAAAEFTAQCILPGEKTFIGLPTGETPIGMYAELCGMYKNGGVSFEDCVTFNLDEYCGLKANHEQSYRYFMEKNLFSKVNIKKENINFLSGCCTDAEAECRRYDAALQGTGGLDLQVLGMGVNGHIGFNEPGEAFFPDSHRVTLTPSTIEANSRFFVGAAEVPRAALTMGVRPVMQAKRILLLVSGEQKCALLKRALNGPVTPQIPVSLLLLHGDVTVMQCL